MSIPANAKLIGDFDELYNKENDNIIATYKVTIEYIATQILIELTSPETAVRDVFDKIAKEHPKFSLGNLVLYPLFIALSNGNSKSLFNLFAPFVYISGIPISLSLIDHLISARTDQNYFDFYIVSDQNNLILFKDADELKLKTLANVRNSLLNKQLNHIPQSLYFENALIINDKLNNQPLFNAIDSAIKALTRQSNNSFFSLSVQDLKLQASFLDTMNNSIEDGKSFQYSEVEVISRRPYYEEVS